MNGEGGTDTLRVDYRTRATNIDYRYVTNGCYTFTDDFASRIDHYGFERYELWFGSGDDALSGGALGNSLAGGGADTLDGGTGGADRILGGLGAETWVMNLGDSTLAHHLTLSANGNDLVIVDASLADGPVETVCVGNGWYSVRSATGAYNMQYAGIERFDLTGTNGSDNISGLAGNDTLRGGDGRNIPNGLHVLDRLQSESD